VGRAGPTSEGATADGSTVDGAFAFCDLAGFTAFTSEHGDEAALGLVEAFWAHVSSELPAGGQILNRIGDGLLLHFEEPPSALPALLAITERCRDHSTPGRPLWVRTGVHVGTARRLGGHVLGHDVNVAARIGALAAAAEVLASESARGVTDPEAVTFVALGPVFVKGVPDPLRLFRAARVGAALLA
jgi:adenylate cyclase